jgi:thymidylate kinase
LQVPTHLASQLASKRGSRPYLNGKKDIHEEDTDHIQRVNTLYDQLSKRYKHWITINSVKGDYIDTIENIHQKILNILKEKKIIINI